MKRLIINADDLGADEGRNDGILEAIRAGMVTSASILPNGPALQHALRGIRAGSFEKVSFGVHLNLTEGRPLAEGLSCLTGPDGSFRGKADAHRLLIAKGDAALRSEIASEAALQIDRLLDAAIGITHVDGHQHVHVFPAVLLTVAETAKSRGIRRMRIPDEAVSPGDETIHVDLLEEARRFSAMGKNARACLDGSGILTPDHFYGLLLKGRLSAEALVTAIEHLPDGLTELMVHPGRVAAGSASGPFAGFSTQDREREIEALLDPAVRRALKRAGVLLTSYREVVP
jgi:chitin disaccharide deacetylase